MTSPDPYDLHVPVGILPRYDTPSKPGRPPRRYKTPRSANSATTSLGTPFAAHGPVDHPPTPLAHAARDHDIDPDWLKGFSSYAGATDITTGVSSFRSPIIAHGDTWAHEAARAADASMNLFATGSGDVKAVSKEDRLQQEEIVMEGITVTKEALRRSTIIPGPENPAYLRSEESLQDLPRIFDREVCGPASLVWE